MEGLSKEQLLSLLKEHLKISITTKPHEDYYKGVTGYDINVQLHLGTELISESTDTIDVK